MDARIEVFLDEFDGIVELHAEYADTIDPDDIEARAVWAELDNGFKRLSRRVKRLRREATASEAEMDEIDALMDGLNDQYGELAALL